MSTVSLNSKPIKCDKDERNHFYKKPRVKTAKIKMNKWYEKYKDKLK